MQRPTLSTLWVCMSVFWHDWFAKPIEKYQPDSLPVVIGWYRYLDSFLSGYCPNDVAGMALVFPRGNLDQERDRILIEWLRVLTPITFWIRFFGFNSVVWYWDTFASVLILIGGQTSKGDTVRLLLQSIVKGPIRFHKVSFCLPCFLTSIWNNCEKSLGYGTTIMSLLAI